MSPGPYLSYKPSGVEWLGDVPDHWDIVSTKQSYEIQLGKMLQPTPRVPDDRVTPYLKAVHVQWFSVRTMDAPTMWASPREITQFGIQKGDLLVCEAGEGGRSGIVSADVTGYIIQNALHRIRPDGLGLNQYLQFVMYVAAAYGWLDALNDKATIAHFTREKLAAFRIPLPPLPEQTAIVRYLGHADRRIRRYINAKRRLIALLKEERQAIVNRAVTRGLDPDVRLKPSGVEWLGDVPEHWEVRKLRSILAETTERDRPDWPLLSVVRERGVILRDVTNKDENHNYVPDDLTNYKVVHKGQFAMNKMKAWQGSYGVSMYDGIVSPAYYVFDIGEVTGDYFHLAIRSKAYVPFFGQASDGVRIGQWDLSKARMQEISFPLPPLLEQRAIVENLEDATVGVDTAIVRARRRIELMEEYRTRLIADVVTGKLDVREAAAQLPDEADDQDSIEETGPLTDGIDKNLYDTEESVEEPATKSEVSI